MDDHLKKTKGNKLPLIYPIVIYHAARPYPYSTNICDLVNAPKELIDRYFFKPFHLIDLGQIDDEKLKHNTWVGIMEFVLKHIFARDLIPYLQQITKSLRLIDQTGGRDFVSIVLQYILARGEIKDKLAFYNLINTEISSEVGDQVMSLGDQLYEEGMEKGMAKGIESGMAQGIEKGLEKGREEGREEGIFEVAKRLLMDGLAMSYIANITGIPIQKLEILTEENVG